jgi:hypothetical protein
MLRRVVWYILTDVSGVLPVSIIKATSQKTAIFTLVAVRTRIVTNMPFVFRMPNHAALKAVVIITKQRNSAIHFNPV